MMSRKMRLGGLAVLMAIPLAFAQAPSAGAAPIGNVGDNMKATPNAAVLVRRGGGGGPHFGGGGRHFGGGGRHFGGGPRFGGHHFGRPHIGRPNFGHHGPRFGHHFRHRPYIVGVPYYYYGPSYYWDDDYYDDDFDYSDDAVARCRARYRSFDPASGTFLSTDGTRKLCPYLK